MTVCIFGGGEATCSIKIGLVWTGLDYCCYGGASVLDFSSCLVGLAAAAAAVAVRL